VWLQDVLYICLGTLLTSLSGGGGHVQGPIDHHCCLVEGRSQTEVARDETLDCYAHAGRRDNARQRKALDAALTPPADNVVPLKRDA
jgi:hypothetical protein